MITVNTKTNNDHASVNKKALDTDNLDAGAYYWPGSSLPDGVPMPEEKTLHSELEETAKLGTMICFDFCIDDWFRALPNALAIHGTMPGTQIACMFQLFAPPASQCRA